MSNTAKRWSLFIGLMLFYHIMAGVLWSVLNDGATRPFKFSLAISVIIAVAVIMIDVKIEFMLKPLDKEEKKD